MNEYDRAIALRIFNPAVTPNRAHAASVVENLARWADANSDGWHLWKPPARAAERVMRLVASTTNAENEHRQRIDATDAELTAALRPVKAFLTRHGVPHAEVLPTR